MVAPLLWKLPRYQVESVYVAQSQIVDWGLKALKIPELWKTWAGMGVKVAILDTGTPDHPDATEAIVGEKDFTGSRYGPRDVQGHASHCCGIVGARDNGVGVVGVAPECSLICGKVLGDNGSGSSAGVAAGIYWAADNEAHVISLSLGSPSPDQQILEAIRYAVKKGVYVVVAAGNSGPNYGTVEYPGRWSECISVAATNEVGQVSRFSSRGPEVDIAAPGENITSTYLNGQVARLSGTSMATPFVAGVVALAIGKYLATGRDNPTQPFLPTPTQMAERLRQCAVDIDKPGFDPSAGWGLIDPDKLLGSVPPPILPPPTIPPVIPSPLKTITFVIQGRDLVFATKEQ